MKTTRFFLCTILAATLALSTLSACTSSEENAEDAPFDYSEGLDDNGFWKDIKALDYIEIFDYDALPISKDVTEVPEEEVQSQIDMLLESFSTLEEVTDRPAADGDTLNIDFVGSVDGVEFEGGSTDGAGTDVIIGQTSYIDDFIEQLIGHNKGDTFDIDVTFPEDYGQEELNGKDAVFAITVNSISASVEPELTDEFVKENLSQGYGWNTVEELKKGLRDDMSEAAINSYVQDYLVEEVTVKSIPESILKIQEKALVHYYESYASQYGMELDEFLTSFLGVNNTEELLAQSQEDIRNNAVYTLSVQAVAEDAGIKVSEEDMANHFLVTTGSEDYSMYIEEYGIPFIKQTVLSQMVIDRIIENAVTK